MLTILKKNDSKVVRNVLAGSINRVSTILLPFVSRTLIIKILGVEYLGLGSLFSSILSVMSLAELGIGGAIGYSMYRPISEHDNNKICALLNFYKNTYRVIGTIILSVGLVLIPFLPKLISGNVPDGINIYALYLIYLINACSTYFLFAYKQSLLSVHEMAHIYLNIATVLNIAQYIAQLLLLFFFKNYYLYVIILPFISITKQCIVSLYVDKHFPEYKCKGDIDLEQKKSIQRHVSGLFLKKVSDVLLNAVDSIILSAFLGLALLGQYNNYFFIVSSVSSILISFFVELTPTIASRATVQSTNEKIESFNTVAMVNISVVGWCSCVFLFLFQNFIYLWIGPQYMFSDEMVYLFVVLFVTVTMKLTTSIHIDAYGLWWETKWISVITCVFNIVLNIILIRKFGIAGVLFATIIQNLIVMMFDGYFISSRRFEKKYSVVIRKGAESLLIIGLIFGISVYFGKLLPDDTLMSLVLRIIISVILPTFVIIPYLLVQDGLNKIKQLIKSKRDIN